MDLGLTQPVRNEYQKIFLGAKGRPAPKVDNFAAIFEPTVQEIWDLWRS
jgi:hypothetical protein